MITRVEVSVARRSRRSVAALTLGNRIKPRIGCHVRCAVRPLPAHPAPGRTRLGL